MSRLRSLTAPALSFLALSATALSWHTIYRTTRLPEELADAYRQRVFPAAMRGLKLNLLDNTVLVGSDKTLSSFAARTLVLMGSETCTKSKANQSHWKQLIDTLPQGSVSEVWILGFGGDKYLTELAQYLSTDTTVPFRVLRRRDRTTFGLHTGLAAVPDTLVLDNEGRIALNLIGVLRDDDIALVRAALRRRLLSH